MKLYYPSLITMIRNLSSSSPYFIVQLYSSSLYIVPFGSLPPSPPNHPSSSLSTPDRRQHRTEPRIGRDAPRTARAHPRPGAAVPPRPRRREPRRGAAGVAAEGAPLLRGRRTRHQPSVRGREKDVIRIQRQVCWPVGSYMKCVLFALSRTRIVRRQDRRNSTAVLTMS